MVVFVILLLLVGCSDTSSSNYDAEVRIDELESTLEEMDAKVSDLEMQIDGLMDSKEDLENRVDDLESEGVFSSVPRTPTITVNENKEEAQIVEENNPSGGFTVGSSEDHVRKIMGNPDSVTSKIYTYSWWYGKQSYVNFNKDTKLVDSWYDGESILKTQ